MRKLSARMKGTMDCGLATNICKNDNHINNNDYYLLATYSVLGTVLNVLYALFHFTHKTVM